MGELIVYRQEFYNPHQEQFRDFHLLGCLRRFKQFPKGEIGNVVWDAGFVMSKYLEVHYADKFQGKKILEIGSGTGIAGITAALMGGRLTLTDGNDTVLDLLIENTTSLFTDNPASIIINNVKKLEWGNETQQSTLLQEDGPFDYILCADVVYSPPSFSPLIAALRALTTLNHTTILFAYKRRYDVEDQFFKEASHYFEFLREAQSTLHQDYQNADIFVYKVTLKSAESL